MATNLLRLGVAPVREEFDEDQNVRRSPLGREVVSAARTMTPNTWYTRLAVDRLLWDKLQTLVDLDDREGHAGAAAGQRSCVERDMLAKRAMG
jgi:hypothetical protein